MTERQSDTETETVTPREVVIIKAFHALKIKTGPGGFDPYNVAKASQRLENSAHIFPQAASHDITLIEKTLEMIHDDQTQSKVMLKKILASCVELKALSTMFQFPLVEQMADSLLSFCFALKDMTPLARDVVSEHLRVLKIAIAEGPRAITPKDREVLLDGLEKAVQKVLRLQNNA